MKKLLITLGLISTGFLLPSTVLADGTANCTTSYGGYGGYGAGNCVNGNISINKTVQNPANNQFVDNLGSNDAKYNPDQQVNFKLTVSNTGNAGVSNVVVKDVLPSFLDYASSDGSFDANSKTVTITVGQLNPGDSKTYSVVGRVESATQLPTNVAIVCLVNQSTATGDGQPTSQDNAQFCVQENVLSASTTKGGLTVFPTPKVSKTPGTGPDALSLLALIPAVFAGLKLRKNAIRG